MKRRVILFVMALVSMLSAFSQTAPQLMSYQAVIRGVDGQLVQNQSVPVTINIVQGSYDGYVVYSENHVVTTNANGLVMLQIGAGETYDDFSAIDWSKGPYFMETVTEVNGNAIHATTQLLSVPYALYAAKAGNMNEYVKKSELEAYIDARIQALMSGNDTTIQEKQEDEVEEVVDSAELKYIWNDYDDYYEKYYEELTPSTCESVKTAMERSYLFFKSEAKENANTYIDNMIVNKIEDDTDDYAEWYEVAKQEVDDQTRVSNAIKELVTKDPEHFEKYEEIAEKEFGEEGLNDILEELLENDYDAYIEIAEERLDQETINEISDKAQGYHVEDGVIVSAGENAFIGLFSVSATTQVKFSMGNLQYQASTKTWRLAKHQYDAVSGVSENEKRLGEEGGNVYENGTKCTNKNISSTYSGWIDLFGWGTSGWTDGSYSAYQPYATDTINENYCPATMLTGAYSNADWGVQNRGNIEGAGSASWRTLTVEEWRYIFTERPNAASLFSYATVCGIQGFVILPDNGWVLPSDCVFNTNYKEVFYAANTYDQELWNKMQAAGAIFCPCSGARKCDEDGNPQVHSAANFAGYWTATGTTDGGANAYWFRTSISGTGAANTEYVASHAYAKRTGLCVRLVQDAN